MNPVVVRNVAIGEGIPKICVPIVGKTREEILDAARRSFQSEQML
jgi:3-dehydroquinate dehydratase-1